jgi:plasmid maintenance system antidote protein VapI
MPKLTEERLQEIVDALKKTPSIRELEKAAGLPQSTINQIIKGKLKLTDDKAKKLEKAIKKFNL